MVGLSWFRRAPEPEPGRTLAAEAKRQAQERFHPAGRRARQEHLFYVDLALVRGRSF
jgi:hypothetical protein